MNNLIPKITKPKIVSLKPEHQVSAAQAEKLLKLQREILEQVALGVDYKEILDSLCKAAELLVSDSLASIMVYDETTSFLTVLAAPSIPAEAIAALNGLIPSPASGSCGTAVHSNTPQYVTNTRTDCRWRDLQSFVENFAIGACWSSPIKIEKHRTIGSFALSSFEERTPSAFYKQLLETSAHIVSIILKRHQEEQSLWMLAHRDSLTGLENRSSFTKTLETTLAQAKTNKTQFAVLILDLDGFKDVNDTQGHEIGDKVLQWVATEIQKSLTATQHFARLGGDEFVILVEDIESPATLTSTIDTIFALFKQKIRVYQHQFSLSTSIGVSFFPTDGGTTKDLLRSADTAMYAAKRSGRSCVKFYDASLTHSVAHRVNLVEEMRTALSQEDFIVYYQPQFCLNSHKLLGVEALVRWQHPEKGIIPPNDFIAIAEQSGLIKELGLWVLVTACQQCKKWWDSGISDFSLAVNLSVKQLDSESIQQMQECLLAMDFPLHNLEVEVTESLIMQPDSLQELKKLEALGIRIAMDDFGTGYSSLAQLKHLPLSKLKIDRSFIQDLTTNESDRILIKTIIAMGHSLGLKIVAEGVETIEQQDFLAQHDCDLVQGYLRSRPISPEQLTELFELI